MKRRWTENVRTRTADPVSAAKWLTQVWRILHEFGDSREKESCAWVGRQLRRSRSSIRRGNSQRLHFAVEVAAFQTQSGGCLRHVPAVLLQFAQNKFPLIGAARFMQRGVGLVRAFGCAAEEFRRQVMRLDARLGAHDDQPLDEIAQLTDISRPGIANQD